MPNEEQFNCFTFSAPPGLYSIPLPKRCQSKIMSDSETTSHSVGRADSLRS